MFNANLVGGMVLMWVICFVVLYKGVKSFQYVTAVLVPLTFLFLIVLIALYLGLSGSKGGNAAGFYIGGQTMAGLIDESNRTFSNLFIDAYN
jgi:hypothetical protein